MNHTHAGMRATKWLAGMVEAANPARTTPATMIALGLMLAIRHPEWVAAIASDFGGELNAIGDILDDAVRLHPVASETELPE